MVANKYVASSLRFSEEMRHVFMLVDGARLLFPYTFSCKGLSAMLFFDMKTNKMLWVDRYAMSIDGVAKYNCASCSFWVENDLPVPSVKGFMNQEIGVLAHIAEDFKEKLAAYVLDGIINS